MKDSIASDVRRFILEHIGSVEMLNVLLLLFAQVQRAWSAEEVGRELRTNEYSADLQLEELTARGLITKSGEQPPRYQADGRFAAAVAAAAHAFRERRVAVITLIYSRPDDSQPEDAGAGETDPVTAFADAFKLRKDK